MWLYGSKGKNNGEYKITLDDATVNSAFVGNGFSEDHSFRHVLFEAKGLDGNKTHRLTVENVGMDGTYLVIDSVS